MLYWMDLTGFTGVNVVVRGGWVAAGAAAELIGACGGSLLFFRLIRGQRGPQGVQGRGTGDKEGKTPTLAASRAVVPPLSAAVATVAVAALSHLTPVFFS